MSHFDGLTHVRDRREGSTSPWAPSSLDRIGPSSGSIEMLKHVEEA